MKRKDFEAFVIETIKSLPLEFKSKLDNLAVVIADWPSQDQLKRMRLKSKMHLLGLYEGVPRTQRGSGYNLVPPDRITLFQKPIEAKCHNDEETKAEIIRVVQHEIAHHFGLSDSALRQIENRKTPNQFTKRPRV
jgi:predicted Zn-dependent protease with MMP-like domain